MSTHTHRHMVLTTGKYVWHTHEHTCDGPLADFNLLHHHAPVEHDLISADELERWIPWLDPEVERPRGWVTLAERPDSIPRTADSDQAANPGHSSL